MVFCKSLPCVNCNTQVIITWTNLKDFSQGQPNKGICFAVSSWSMTVARLFGELFIRTHMVQTTFPYLIPENISIMTGRSKLFSHWQESEGDPLHENCQSK